MICHEIKKTVEISTVINLNHGLTIRSNWVRPFGQIYFEIVKTIYENPIWQNVI
jgi:hypothetical protein